MTGREPEAADDPSAWAGHRIRPGLDARLAGPAAMAWIGSWVATGWPRAGLVLVAGAAIAGLAVIAVARRRGGGLRWVAVAALAAGAAAAASGAWAVASVQRGPVDEWAAEQRVVRAVLRLQADPRPVAARATAPTRVAVDAVLVRAWTGASGSAAMAEHGARPAGAAAEPGQPVAVLAPAAGWAGLLPGAEVSATGTLASAADPDRAAILAVRGPPGSGRDPSAAQRAAGALRSGLRAAAEPLAPDPAGLLPGLAVGDEVRLPRDLADAMRATGLGHLTAVSGANVTLIVGAVLWLGRLVGLRGRALPLLAVVAVLGFVVVARPQPSVVRAAAMGLVALAALGRGTRPAALPALAASVAVLVVADPWLARSYGFALSALATLGLVLAAPRAAALLGRWLPTPLAQALAVTLVAQAFVAPVVLLLQPELSWVAVPANLLAAPAVAVVTWGGVAAALASAFAEGPARLCAEVAGYPAGWIAWVARRGAEVPYASLPWPRGPTGAAAYLLVGLLGLAAWRIRAAGGRGAGLRPLRAVGAIAVVVAVSARVELPSAWPPADWLAVACSVGQGDALALNLGGGSALVVDTGPDPEPVAACLDDLGVRRVPVLVLSHFHADHVGGLAGVLAGRAVDRILVSPLGEPAEQAERVQRLAAEAGLPLEAVTAGQRLRVGEAAVEVVWPARAIEIGSRPNQASVVMLVSMRGVRLLLAGDVEPAAQVALRARSPSVRADVLKVAHHGSRHQDPGLARSVRPAVALVSVGEGNDYGHPAAMTLEALRGLGAAVGRTDRDGDLAVVVRPGAPPALVARGAGAGWHAGP